MTTVNGTGAATANNASPVSILADSTGSGNFTDFLKLLTTQVQNQDPLNPTDSTQFVEQLATFTAVEQQVGTNAKLDTLIELNNVVSWSELAGWVGREVTADGAGHKYEGEPLTVDVPVETDAASVAVIIHDAEGKTVNTLEAAMGESVTWNGKDEDGEEAEEGIYFIEFSYTPTEESGLEENWSTFAEGSGIVVEAQIVNGALKLILDNGAEVMPDTVTSIRSVEEQAAEEAAADE